MGKTTFEEALSKVDSVYRLVVLASKRARQLDNGATRLVKVPYKKNSLAALAEIAAGKVTYEITPIEEEGFLS